MLHIKELQMAHRMCRRTDPRIIYVSELARVCVNMFEYLDIALVLQKYTCNNISDEKMY